MAFVWSTDDGGADQDAATAPPCADAGDLFIEVAGDGPMQTYRGGCQFAAIPFGGHVYAGGEGDSVGEGAVTACVGATLSVRPAQPWFVYLSSPLSDVGDTDAAALMYDDADGRRWIGTAALHVAQWSAVGGTIEGSYSGTATVDAGASPDGGAPRLGLTGNFRVCHAFDGPPAP
jgi:hypothetical protein